MSVITKLSDTLSPKLESADELWVAVGLINVQGLNFLLEKTKPNCLRNFLVGIDLPTHPNALERLNYLQFDANFKVRLYTDREFFHPKLYLVRNKNIYTGFIGSANCTNGGLNTNVELTARVEGQAVCADLKSWFESRFDQAKHLTKSFVEEYRAHYSQRQRHESEDKKTTMELKKGRNTLSLTEEIDEVVKSATARFLHWSHESSGPSQSPIEQAWKIKLLLEAGKTKKEIKRMFSPHGGRKGMKEAEASNSWLNLTVRFLEFPMAIQEKIHVGSLPLTAAYRLQEEEQEKWQEILDRAEYAREGENVRKRDIEDAANDIRYENR